MSTKIYYGIKITDTDKFMKEIQTIRAEILNEYTPNGQHRLYLDWFLHESNMFEQGYRKPTTKDNQQFELEFVRNRSIYRLPYQHPFDLSLSYFPEKQLALIYGQNEKFYHRLLQSDTVEDYVFWDNTDKPEDISDEDWATRGADWDDAFAYVNPNVIDCGHVYQKGIVIDVFKEEINWFFIDNNLEEKLPRAIKKYIKNQLLNRAFDLFATPEEKEKADNADLDDYPDVVKKARQLYNQNVGDHKLEEYITTHYPETKNIFDTQEGNATNEQ